jgi:hypothetical protein
MNAGAANVRLSSGELAQIDEVAPKGFAAGGRYQDMSTVNIRSTDIWTWANVLLASGEVLLLGRAKAEAASYTGRVNRE